MIACDLGSNTLRIVELECKSGKRLREFERMVKTADGLHESGIINDAALERIIGAIEDAKEIFDLRAAYGVTTAAIRMARNGAEILAKIAQKTGLKFIMIDAQEEARLTRLAVSYRLEKLGYRDDFVLMDLGGGSTEISVGERSKSFDTGIVTMAQKYGTPEAVKSNVDKELSPLYSYLKSFEKPSLFVATAGTPTTIAAFMQGLDYAHYDVEKVNGTKLSLADLDRALERLLAMEAKEREVWVGVGRDDLIVAGVLMVKVIMIEAGFSEMLVIDDGLREGLALEKCKKNGSFSIY